MGRAGPVSVSVSASILVLVLVLVSVSVSAFVFACQRIDGVTKGEIYFQVRITYSFLSDR